MRFTLRPTERRLRRQVGLLFVYLRFLCLKEERQEREDFNAPPPVNPELGQSAGMIVVEVRDEHPSCTAHLLHLLLLERPCLTSVGGQALPITRSQEAEMASAPQATVVEP